MPVVSKVRGLAFFVLAFGILGGCAERPPQAAIAAAHPLAARAGLEILEAGGNAFDAAVAVTATLAVVEPYSSGLGGGGFWLLFRAHDERYSLLDGRETAPSAAHRDMYLDEAGELIPRASLDGALAAGIPGVAAGLDYLATHYGALPLAVSLAPAIRHARTGFAVSERYRRMAAFRLDALRASPAAAEVFLLNGEVPPIGYMVRQPALAATLERIAVVGRAGFYHGPIARRLVAGVQAGGGIWTLTDLADYHIKEREPIVGEYQGTRVVSAAPPSSGGVALVEMLNILSGFDLDAMDPVTQKHVIIEAMRRAYRDRADALGDPDFVEVPVARLTDPAYGKGLAATIELDRATPSTVSSKVEAPQSSGHQTTHFSIIDFEGNRVAATLSINYPFGSAFIPSGTGVLLNDEMDDFSVRPGTPNAYGLVGGEANAIAPGKRPLSSMTPTFLERDDRIASLGTPGGSRIITMVLLAALDFAAGKGPVSWVGLPRYHHQYLPDEVQFEPGALDEFDQIGLARRGHTLRELNRPYGNMQAILWDAKTGAITAASDPRGEGQGVVLSATRQA
ncbi:MAG: gamma-glutamyltransferase, partial [Gammaproteobacteria bacterium]